MYKLLVALCMVFSAGCGPEFEEDMFPNPVELSDGVFLNQGHVVGNINVAHDLDHRATELSAWSGEGIFQLNLSVEREDDAMMLFFTFIGDTDHEALELGSATHFDQSEQKAGSWVSATGCVGPSTRGWDYDAVADTTSLTVTSGPENTRLVTYKTTWKDSDGNTVDSLSGDFTLSR